MDNNKIIHLFVTERCTHNCELCCNKQYNIDDIPVVSISELRYADTVLLTGGEPFLIGGIDRLAKLIKMQYRNIKSVYVYTCGDSLLSYLKNGGFIDHIDGVNISPKNELDAHCLNVMFFSETISGKIDSLSSNRLYVFPEVRQHIRFDKIDGHNIQIIDREWQKDFKSASGIFRRIPILFC